MKWFMKYTQIGYTNIQLAYTDFLTAYGHLIAKYAFLQHGCVIVR